MTEFEKCVIHLLIEIRDRLKMLDENCPNHYDFHNIHCLICDFAEKCKNEKD